MSIKTNLKVLLAARAPWALRFYSFLHTRLVKRPRYRSLGMAVFNEKYQSGGWGEPESLSGRGSTLAQTQTIRETLPKIVADYQIRSVLDIPCGDLNWISRVELGADYIGADVVPGLIEQNRAKFPDRRFEIIDITKDSLPSVGLVICRDLLFHFSFADTLKALSNIKASNSSYLLTTTNPELQRNREIVTGEWRRLNLMAAPFGLPRPLMMINEQSSNPDEPDKYMGLWRISDL